MKMSQKLRAIRKAEGLTQAKFCELTGLAISTLKNYEGEHREPGIQIVTQIVNTPLFKKYTLWIMTDETAPQAGQVAPAFAHIGRESTESDHSEKKTG